MLARFFAWLRHPFGGAGNDPVDRIHGHLETLRIRRLTYQDQRHELDERIGSHEKQRSAFERQLRKLVEQDKHRTREAIELGRDLDTLKETITDLIARSGNRRKLENLLRRVVNAGEELMAFLPQQPDMAGELEENLRELAEKMGAEPAQALGRMLAFLETKLDEFHVVPVRLDPLTESEEQPQSLQDFVAEKEQRQRAEIEAEEVSLDVPDQQSPAEIEPSRPEEQE